MWQLTDDTIQCSPGGSFAKFVQIDEDNAIKLYRSADMRDATRHNQERLAEVDLAPEVGQAVDFPQLSEWKYGYWTEVVQVSDDGGPLDQFLENLDYIECLELEHLEGDFENACEVDSHFRGQEDLFDYLKEIYDETGLIWIDHHDGNWGIKAGKIIPIDFDMFYEV